MAKLSIGFGANIFTQGFSDAAYTKELRNVLWPKVLEIEKASKVLSSNFWQQNQADFIQNHLGSAGAWTLLFKAHQDVFTISIITPNLKILNMVIADDQTLWSSPDLQAYHDGIVHLIVPPRRAHIGPIALHEFIAHTLGHSKNSALIKFEEMKIDPSSLPPKQR